METWELAEHFLLGKVVADVIANKVAASSDLQGGCVVADGRHSFEGLSAAKTNEQLRLACSTLTYKRYLLFAGS